MDFITLKNSLNTTTFGAKLNKKINNRNMSNHGNDVSNPNLSF